MSNDFSYEKTLKNKPENNFLNFQNLFFISSKQITKFLYHTPVTPHQVILLSMIFGLAASYLIIQQSRPLVILGAFLLFYKNVLDKVDGSLARVKGLDSRRGRFYDSIADFIVTLASFSAISYKLFLRYDNYIVFLIGFLAMVSSMLQCSYFIYYEVSLIRYSGKKTVNRLIETVTDEDIKSQDKLTTLLQRIFLLIYGWQDFLAAKLDAFVLNKLTSKFLLSTQHTQHTPSTSQTQDTLSVRSYRTQNPALAGQVTQYWYRNMPFLTLASLLPIGTHIFLICIAAVFDAFEYYFFVNLICMNLLLILSIIYHYKSTLNHLK